MISITSPVEGQQVSGSTKISTIIQSQGEPISRVVFTLNGTSIGEDFSAPYELDWDANPPSEDPQEIGLIAIGSDGSSIAETKINIIVIEDQQIETPTIQSELTSLPDPTSNNSIGNSNSRLLGVLIILGLVGIGIVIFFVVKRKNKKTKKEPVEVFKPDKPIGTIELLISSPINANLIVEKSVDPDHKAGEVIHLDRIKKSYIIIGSGTDETVDIKFIQGAGVSEHHVRLAFQGNDVALTEALKPGEGTRPTFGTAVNDKKVSPQDEPIKIEDGDIIRLGNLTELKYQQIGKNILKTSEILVASKGGQKTSEVRPGEDDE